jgi:hypothetical protein
MIKTLLHTFFIFCLVTSFSLSAFAQDGNMDQLVDESKNDLLVVVGSGLAGAILGLSTLSFVEEPKEHTRNILMGASLGVIFGVGFVVYSQANKSSSALKPVPTSEEGEFEDTTTHYNGSFDTKSRSRWHSEVNNSLSSPARASINPLSFSYSFAY